MYRRWPLMILAAVGTVVVVVLAARSIHSAEAETQNPPASARAGHVLLVNAFIDEPAGPTAPAGSDLRLYAWLFNDGAVDDRLLSVSTPYASAVTPAAKQLPTALAAQEWIAFEPQQNYLVLRNLVRPVTAGAALPVTFTFADNPPLTTKILVRRQPGTSPDIDIPPLSEVPTQPAGREPGGSP